MGRYSRWTRRDKLALLADVADGLRPFDGRAESLVRQFLDDPDPQVRGEAIACLWSNPKTLWIDLLVAKAQHDPNLDVRTRALSALGRYVFEGAERLYRGEWGVEEDSAEAFEWDEEGEPDQIESDLTESDLHRVTEFLFSVAHDDRLSPDERRFAIESLAFLEDPEVDGLVEWAYSQSDPRYKVSALFAMGRSANLRWSDIVLAEMHSANRDIQFEAVRAAGELGLHEATEDLIHLARGRGISKPLRLLAIYSLGEAGDDRAYPVLEELTRARDRDVREAAREAAEEWLMTSAAEQLEEQDSEDLLAEGLAESETELEDAPGFRELRKKDIWDPVMGVFSRN